MKYTGKYAEMEKQFQKDGADDYTIYQFIKQEMEADEFRKGEGTTDIEAVRLWNSYPDEAKDIKLYLSMYK